MVNIFNGDDAKYNNYMNTQYTGHIHIFRSVSTGSNNNFGVQLVNTNSTESNNNVPQNCRSVHKNPSVTNDVSDASERTCGECTQKIKMDQLYVTCDLCSADYHINSVCSNVIVSGVNMVKTWWCNLCFFQNFHFGTSA